LRVEYADISLLGHRDDNQDRVAIAGSDQAMLLVVVDGMGGHAEGARAAEIAVKSLVDSFKTTQHPVFDPLGFLHMALGKAHDKVVALGQGLTLEARPRATCAIALVQQGAAYWAHIGDSRIYHIRNGVLRRRTRDHSHVEQLLRDGMITEDEVQDHPMRNFVECCLGGDAIIPEMTISSRQVLAPNDMLLLCSDGVWANMSDADLAGFDNPGNRPADATDLRASLAALCTRAVNASAPYSDNTTAATLRWLGE
jgi:serine/threonine protein phosphatase PrpC